MSHQQHRKHVSVSLGGTEYKIPQLTIGQLRRVTKLLTETANRGDLNVGIDRALDVLGIALEHSDPPVGNFEEEVAGTTDELLDAAVKVLTLSGMEQKGSAAGEEDPAAV